MKLDHIAICVDDVKLSSKWYESNLCADIVYIDETWAMLQIGSTKIALTSKGQHPPHIAFLVDRFENIENIKQHRDGSSYVYKSDPDGNIIEMIKYSD